MVKSSLWLRRLSSVFKYREWSWYRKWIIYFSSNIFSLLSSEWVLWRGCTRGAGREHGCHYMLYKSHNIVDICYNIPNISRVLIQIRLGSYQVNNRLNVTAIAQTVTSYPDHLISSQTVIRQGTGLRATLITGRMKQQQMDVLLWDVLFRRKMQSAQAASE